MSAVHSRVAVVDAAKSYETPNGTVPIFRNLSFTVGDQEIVSIVGPSGVGKTTLLRSLVGLQPLSSGRIEFDGEPINGPPRQASMVVQDYSKSLLPWFSVYKNVALPFDGTRVSRAERRERIESAIAAVGLEGSEDKYPFQLSGGMQQRCSIARALAYRPEILVMDEPFASVDAQTRFDLEDLCLSIREEFGMSFVFVTHDIDEAVYMSDRVVVLWGKPAEMVDFLDIPFGRERTQMGTRNDPEFGHLRTRVFTGVKGGVPVV